MALDKIPACQVAVGDVVERHPGRRARITSVSRDGHGTLHVTFAAGDTESYADAQFLMVHQDQSRFRVDATVLAEARRTGRYTDHRGTEWIVDNVREMPGTPSAQWSIHTHRPKH